MVITVSIIRATFFLFALVLVLVLVVRRNLLRVVQILRRRARTR
jgi:hypothetical protein